jgi:hypothetical protein
MGFDKGVSWAMRETNLMLLLTSISTPEIYGFPPSVWAWGQVKLANRECVQ